MQYILTEEEYGAYKRETQAPIKLSRLIMILEKIANENNQVTQAGHYISLSRSLAHAERKNRDHRDVLKEFEDLLWPEFPSVDEDEQHDHGQLDEHHDYVEEDDDDSYEKEYSYESEYELGRQMLQAQALAIGGHRENVPASEYANLLSQGYKCRTNPDVVPNYLKRYDNITVNHKLKAFVVDAYGNAPCEMPEFMILDEDEATL